MSFVTDSNYLWFCGKGNTLSHSFVKKILDIIYRYKVGISSTFILRASPTPFSI